MLVSDAITAAYREADLIPVGTVPTSAEQTEALGVLNRGWRQVVGFELGEPLRDWYIPGPPNSVDPSVQQTRVATLANQWDAPPANVALLIRATTNTTVRLPPDPPPGARFKTIDNATVGVFTVTLDANGRKIDGLSTYVAPSVQAIDTLSWFYRADLGSWQREVDMVLTGQTPLPTEHDDFFVFMLARRLSARNTQQQLPLIDEQYTKCLMRVKAQYTQNTPTGVADPRTSQSTQAYANTLYWGAWS